MDCATTATSTDHSSKKHKSAGQAHKDHFTMPKKPMIRHKQVWFQAKVVSTTATRVTLGEQPLTAVQHLSKSCHLTCPAPASSPAWLPSAGGT